MLTENCMLIEQNQVNLKLGWSPKYYPALQISLITHNEFSFSSITHIPKKSEAAR